MHQLLIKIACIHSITYIYTLSDLVVSAVSNVTGQAVFVLRCTI